MAASPGGDDRRPHAVAKEYGMVHGACPLARSTVEFGGIATHVERLKPNSWGKHTYDRWLILAIFEPADLDLIACWHKAELKSRHLDGGHVVFIPPGFQFALTWRGTADAILLFATREWTSRAFPNMSRKYEIVRITDCVAAVPLVADMFGYLRQFSQQRGSGADCDVGTGGAFLAALLCRARAKLIDGQYIPVGLSADIIAKMREHLHQHRKRRVPVGQIARQMGISDRHLRRVVRQETGKSPVEWVREEKARQVRDLLSQGIPLKQAVIQSGFSNPSHLHRAMVRVYGATPRAFYRRQG
jgi:AraC-like DNA-binding protein